MEFSPERTLLLFRFYTTLLPRTRALACLGELFIFENNFGHAIDFGVLVIFYINYIGGTAVDSQTAIRVH